MAILFRPKSKSGSFIFLRRVPPSTNAKTAQHIGSRKECEVATSALVMHASLLMWLSGSGALLPTRELDE